MHEPHEHGSESEYQPSRQEAEAPLDAESRSLHFPGTESNHATEEPAADSSEPVPDGPQRRTAKLAVSREARVGIAAVLSFLILVCVFVLNRGKKTTDPKADTAANQAATKGQGGAKRDPKAGDVGNKPRTPAPAGPASIARKNPPPKPPDRNFTLEIGRNTGDADKTPTPPEPTTPPDDESAKDAAALAKNAKPDTELPEPTTESDLGNNGNGDLEDLVSAPKSMPPLPGESQPTAANEKGNRTNLEDVPTPVAGGKVDDSGSNPTHGTTETNKRKPGDKPSEAPALETPAPATAGRTGTSPASADDRAKPQVKDNVQGGDNGSQPGELAMPAPATPAPTTPAQAPVDSTAKLTSISGASPIEGGLIPLPNAKGSLRDDLDVPPRVARAAAATKAVTSTPLKDEKIEPLTHVVQRGENFWTISRLYYNSGRFYKALWAANKEQVAAPDQLYVGTAIRVPPPEALDPQLIEPPAAERASTPAQGTRKTADRTSREKAGSGPRKASDVVVMLPVGTPREELPPPPVTEPEAPRVLHVVRPHETLRSIARDVLGDPRRDNEIRDLNLDEIGDGPLKVGQRLRLPDGARVRR